MKSDIEKIYLIDRFLKGELSGSTLDEFKSRMRTDKEFALEVKSQKAIIEGIKMARRQHLISILNGDKLPVTAPVVKEKPADVEATDTIIEPKASTKVLIENDDFEQYKLRPNYNNWYFAAAAVLFAAMACYFVFGYWLPRQNSEMVITDTTRNTITRTDDSEATPGNEDEDSIDLAVNPFTKDTLDKVATHENSNGPVLPGDSLKVEKDKKTTQSIYSVSAFETVSPIGTEKDDGKVSTGDPDGLKVSNVKKVRGTTVKVEYWQSVVNFKGYKLSDSKLQLYDVKPEESVSFKYLDKQLYMKKNGSFYKMNASGNFEQYQKETNSDVIKILEEN